MPYLLKKKKKHSCPYTSGLGVLDSTPTSEENHIYSSPLAYSALSEPEALVMVPVPLD